MGIFPVKPRDLPGDLPVISRVNSGPVFKQYLSISKLYRELLDIADPFENLLGL